MSLMPSYVCSVSAQQMGAMLGKRVGGEANKGQIAARITHALVIVQRAALQLNGSKCWQAGMHGGVLADTTAHQGLSRLLLCQAIPLLLHVPGAAAAASSSSSSQQQRTPTRSVTFPSRLFEHERECLLLALPCTLGLGRSLSLH